MTDPDHDLELDLARLRPQAPAPTVTAALARELDPAPGRRGVVIAWTAGLTTAAASLALGWFLARPTGSEEAPSYQLVRAEQSPANIEVLRPVRLDDGSFARPVRVRWDNTTQWEDPRTRTRFINYRPNEATALLPLETY
jgi:hypothetical protein